MPNITMPIPTGMRASRTRCMFDYVTGMNYCRATHRLTRSPYQFLVCRITSRGVLKHVQVARTLVQAERTAADRALSTDESYVVVRVALFVDRYDIPFEDSWLGE